MQKILLLLFFTIPCLYANLLQETIDNAPNNAVLKLPKGTFIGNITINKPLTIIGKGKEVVIQGENKASVITITSSNVTLKNLTIQGSGSRIDERDAAIKINNAKNILIDNCTIQESLYGIDMGMVQDSTISNNKITSKDLPIELRGNAIKLFYSNHNKIINNEIYFSKDMILSYSHNNLITKNHVEKSRFALHLMKSNNNHIIENHFNRNSVGLIFEGAKDTIVEKNSITKSYGKASIGVFVKGVSDFKFKDNIVSYNSKAFYIDAKHNEEEIKRFITNNEITYNIEALHFHAAIKYNLVQNNVFVGNIEDVVKSTRGNYTSKNSVEKNYWDHYSGFDQNNDNIGDTSYKIFQYADRLWHYNHNIKFFYATPVISITNFILKLAPFIEPVLLLEDTDPIVELRQMSTS